MMKKILFCAAAAAVLGGCAANQPVASTEEATVREYPTGSNIPRKSRAGATDGVNTYDKEALERARDQSAQQVRPGLGGTP
jgi:hypothetical protein